MANLTVDHIKTIVQSILAGVTRYKPNLSVTDPDDPRYVVGADKVATKSDMTTVKAEVTSMGTRLSTLEEYEDATNQLAQSAQQTATTAQSTADAAKTAASTAQSTADAAKTAASTAQSTADAALPKAGGTMTGNMIFGNGLGSLSTTGVITGKSITLQESLNSVGATLSFYPQKNAETQCWIGRDSESDPSAPSTLWFIPNASNRVILKGMNTLTMKSNGGNFLNLYIDNDGQLKVTDSSNKEITQAAQSTADAAQSTADAIKAAGADWDQNDSTALDFIKNRTHYSVPTQTIKCDTAVVTEQISQSVAGSGSSSTGMYALKTDAPLPTAEDIIGARVTIDDVTYTITSEDILKNSSTVYACKYLPNRDWTQSAGIVAFFVNTENSSTYATFPSGLNNAHTVVTLPGRGVYFQTYGTTIEYGGGVVPLDEKYLPASVTSITLKSATSGSTKRFRLTVDDTGTIKAEEVTT